MLSSPAIITQAHSLQVYLPVLFIPYPESPNNSLNGEKNVLFWGKHIFFTLRLYNLCNVAFLLLLNFLWKMGDTVPDPIENSSSPLKCYDFSYVEGLSKQWLPWFPKGVLRCHTTNLVTLKIAWNLLSHSSRDYSRTWICWQFQPASLWAEHPLPLSTFWC